MNLGETIKKKRQEKKISRDDLAKRLNISVSTLSKYEQNQRQPKLKMLKEIAKALDTPVEFLIDNPSLENTLEKFKILDSEVQNISEREKKEQLLMSSLDEALKGLDKLKVQQLSVEELFKEHKKLLEKQKIDSSFIGLCKSLDITIKGATNESDELTGNYNIKYKNLDFTISEKNFKHLLNEVSNAIIKEVIFSENYDFLGIGDDD